MSLLLFDVIFDRTFVCILDIETCELEISVRIESADSRLQLQC